LSDNKEELLAIADFLASLSHDIPFHLSAYHPSWKLETPSTRPERLYELARIARLRLRFVYIGNIATIGSDTVCPSCGATVVARQGYRINTRGLRKDGAKALCASCGHVMPIIV
jgi:pyruvate formate lyase activating enzyme